MSGRPAQRLAFPLPFPCFVSFDPPPQELALDARQMVALSFSSADEFVRAGQLLPTPFSMFFLNRKSIRKDDAALVFFSLQILAVRCSQSPPFLVFCRRCRRYERDLLGRGGGNELPFLLGIFFFSDWERSFKLPLLLPREEEFLSPWLLCSVNMVDKKEKRPPTVSCRVRGLVTTLSFIPV